MTFSCFLDGFVGCFVSVRKDKSNSFEKKRMGRLQFRQLWLLMVSALLSQGSSQQSAESTSNSGNTVSEKSRLAMTPALIRAGDGFDLTLSGLILVGLTHLKRCQRGDKAVE